jgi:threonine/homoserine/homoserine lactone efflux protein
MAALTFLYSLVLTVLAGRLRSRMHRHPWLGPWLQKLAGVVLVGFGLRLIFQK